MSWLKYKQMIYLNITGGGEVMNSVQARERIYHNMDHMALELDTIDSLITIRNQANFCINNIVKLIKQGRVSNSKLEKYTKQSK